MKLGNTILAIILLSLFSLAAAQTASTTPTVAPASGPASMPSEAAMKLLAEQEQAGLANATVEANIVYHVDMRLTGDQEERVGTVAFKRQTDDSPAKFFIRFDTLRQGEGKPIAEKEEYVFDGSYLTEAKYRIKKMTRYQVVAEGEKVDPLEVGKGPFPLPFGQKVDTVVKYFDVRTRDAVKTDPPNTDFLRLVTRPQYKDEKNFLWVEMWVDRQTHLPVKLISENKNDERTTVYFSDVKTNVQVDVKIFKLERPSESDWQYEVMPLKRK